MCRESCSVAIFGVREIKRERPEWLASKVKPGPLVGASVVVTNRAFPGDPERYSAAPAWQRLQ